MQFSSQTEYSIRILLYLTCQQPNGRPTPINELSEALGINRNYLPKILKPLKDHGLLRSESGSQGGFSLAVDPHTVSLLDIFQVTEGVIKLNPCLEDSESCNLNRSGICPVQQVYLNFQELFETYFKSKTLASLAEQELAMQHIQIDNEKQVANMTK